MINNYLKYIITECVRQALYESNDTDVGHHTETATPEGFYRDNFLKNVGHGNHSGKLDAAPEPSTITPDEENFRPDEHFFVSEQKFEFYKIKHFGRKDINDTLQFFGGDTRELSKAINTVNGAARRNGKFIRYRTITPEKFKNIAIRKDYMYRTFWEFTFDNQQWYILKPSPVQNLKQSFFRPPTPSEGINEGLLGYFGGIRRG